jgi:hypothetical protein
MDASKKTRPKKQQEGQIACTNSSRQQQKLGTPALAGMPVTAEMP